MIHILAIFRRYKVDTNLLGEFRLKKRVWLCWKYWQHWYDPDDGIWVSYTQGATKFSNIEKIELIIRKDMKADKLKKLGEIWR